MCSGVVESRIEESHSGLNKTCDKPAILLAKDTPIEEILEDNAIMNTLIHQAHNTTPA